MGLMARKKGKAKRKYTRKKKKGGRKPIQRGIVGKLGAFFIGVVPAGVSGAEAAGTAMSLKTSKKLTAMGTLEIGFYRFVNNMSYGYFGVSPYADMNIPIEGGGKFRTGQNVGVPKGAHLVVTGTGLGMMVFDYIASKLAGGRPVKIIGTNYNATGGS